MRFHVAACISLLSLVGTTTAASKVPYERLDRNKAVLVVDDFQLGTFALARDFDASVFRAHTIAHAALGKLFPEMPVILTTSHEQGFNGPMIPEILKLYPNVPVIKRVGELDAWQSAEFRQAIRATGRSQIILAGISTDVCTAFLALTLRSEGYSVWANAEASGTTTPFVRDITNDRMREAGVQVVSLLSITMELWGNTNNPPGEAAVGAWSRQYNPAFASNPGPAGPS